MRVLHVVESMGAGVMTSLLAMVDATPDLQHHLAVWPRREHDDTGADRSAFAGTHALPAGLREAVGALRSLVPALAPHVLHAHSSYAGLLARLAQPAGVPIAYSPHCFAFEREDLSVASRTLVRRIERSLAGRTDLVVAVSPHEALLARRLGHSRVVLVPNRALHAAGSTPATQGPPAAGEPLHVVTLGRVSPQKDWRLFVEARNRAVLAGLHARWTWLGGGEPTGTRVLRDSGVEVTGWLPHHEVASRLAAAHAYLHTAAWESAPMSILEAADAGLPLVVRELPALASLGTPGVVPDADGLAARLVSLADPVRWYDARASSFAFAARHTRWAQRDALLDAYALVGRDAELVREAPR